MDNKTFEALQRVLILARMQENLNPEFGSDNDKAILQVAGWIDEVEKDIA